MIQTKSSFFYISPVDTTNYYLDFVEGAGPTLSARVEIGKYTVTDLSFAVADALNTTGTQAYTVTFDRSTRKYTIAAASNFKLMKGTGPNVGSDLYSALGFTGADTALGLTFTGNLAAGTEYRPQFKLQSYVDAENNQNAVSVSVNKTAMGDVEVVKFGVEKFFEMNITFITDMDQGSGNILDNDPSAELNARSFLQFCVEKRNLEFMPDRDDVDSYFKVLLESTQDAKDGTGFKLYELYDKGLPGYFETKLLVFRLRE